MEKWRGEIETTFRLIYLIIYKNKFRFWSTFDTTQKYSLPKYSEERRLNPYFHYILFVFLNKSTRLILIDCILHKYRYSQKIFSLEQEFHELLAVVCLFLNLNDDSYFLLGDCINLFFMYN